MKAVLFIWLLATVVVAGNSRVRPKSSSVSHGAPGVQFGVDRKLSISVFSDLHFGERELARCIFSNKALLIYHSCECAQPT